jgi:LysM repeat protein
MSITHDEARRLIQFKADEELKEFDKNLLETHIRSCPECQSYEADLNDLESTLRPLLRRKWNQSPLPYSTTSLVARISKKSAQNIFVATRIAAMGLICIAFLFNIWQFTRPGGQGSIQPSANIPLIPTPSQQSTQIKMTYPKCEPIVYVVQQEDTLGSIASRFSVSPQEIKIANQLKSETLTKSMNLSIPVCDTTPSGTPNIVNTTFTPLIELTTRTPVNSSTQ